MLGQQEGTVDFASESVEKAGKVVQELQGGAGAQKPVDDKSKAVDAKQKGQPDKDPNAEKEQKGIPGSNLLPKAKQAA